VHLLADLDRRQSLRHHGAPRSSGEWSSRIVAAERPGVIMPNG
jgi:hypothetical protein